jgi:type I restriction enzyme R subunit
MVTNTREIALEQAIQKHLTGQTTEEMGFDSADIGNKPYRIGLPSDFNAQFALDTAKFWLFLQETQAKELTKLQTRSPSDWQAKILERFDRMVKKNGILHLLKKGLDVDEAHLTLMYPAPLASSSDRVKENFESNI